MSNALSLLTNKLAVRLGMGDGLDLVETLKATAFKGQVNDAQMTALMVVANEYGLNPWTKEIYAFPDKNNGIVPVVGVDGWSRIINRAPEFDGIEFEQTPDACTCIIYRKDRSHPIKVTEYMDECRRSNMGPWASHPRRMLRHKAMIQCARIAFGYGGIYDQDEAERIVENSIDPDTGEITRKAEPARPALGAYPDADFAANLPAWRKAIESGRKTPADLIAMVNTKAVLTEQQIRAIHNLAPIEAQPTSASPQSQTTDQFLADME
jgi:phage recombination protein Bet